MIKKELQQELNRTKVVLDYARQEIKEKDKEIERLNNRVSELEKAVSRKEEEITDESTKWESKFYDEAKKVDKAIEYIEKNSYTTIETIDDINYFIVRLDKCVDLLDILKGVDEE